MRFAKLTPAGPLHALERAGFARPLASDPFGTNVTGSLASIARGTEVPCDGRRFAPPVTPSKIVCVGRNYALHAKELGNEVPKEPLLFLKPPSSLLGHGGSVVLPPESERVEHEVELAVVIGQTCRNVAADAALAHVFGYTLACDVTARDLQRKDVQFTRAKGFDTFCPLGPWIETELDPRDIGLRLSIDGVTRQDGRTCDMIFDVPFVVAYVSRMMTLLPGDVILTGTPAGVGPLQGGEHVRLEADGLGALDFHVAAKVA